MFYFWANLRSQVHHKKTEDEVSAVRKILHKAFLNKEVLLEYEKPFIEKLYDVSPEPDKRKVAIKNSVETVDNSKISFIIFFNINTDDVASIPYVKTRIEPCVTLKEENQGKSFVNHASFVPIQMQFMDFVDKTIQAGIPKFWDYFEGNPTGIAPNLVITLPTINDGFWSFP